MAKPIKKAQNSVKKRYNTKLSPIKTLFHPESFLNFAKIDIEEDLSKLN